MLKLLSAMQPVAVHAVIRTIATARIVMPKTIIRLAAGRHTFSETEQAMVSPPARNGFGHERLLIPESSISPYKSGLYGRCRESRVPTRSLTSTSN